MLNESKVEAELRVFFFWREKLPTHLALCEHSPVTYAWSMTTHSACSCRPCSCTGLHSGSATHLCMACIGSCRSQAKHLLLQGHSIHLGKDSPHSPSLPPYPVCHSSSVSLLWNRNKGLGCFSPTPQGSRLRRDQGCMCG